MIHRSREAANLINILDVLGMHRGAGTQPIMRHGWAHIYKFLRRKALIDHSHLQVITGTVTISLGSSKPAGCFGNILDWMIWSLGQNYRVSGIVFTISISSWPYFGTISSIVRFFPSRMPAALLARFAIRSYAPDTIDLFLQRCHKRSIVYWHTATRMC